MRIDVVDYCVSDIGILAEHVKKHGSTTHEWLNISKLLPLQFSRQMFVKL